MNGAAIGMMDAAYFVGRRAIIDWLNSTFAMNLSKIEETASGAVVCQLLDAIYPGDVPAQKVRWDAKSPHEFIDNYKIVQAVFEKKGIDKHIDVERLMRGKYQDNLENMQWFKSFFERNYKGEPYDPLARRSKGRGADSMPAFAVSEGSRPAGAGAAAGNEDGGPAVGVSRPKGGGGRPAPTGGATSAVMGLSGSSAAMRASGGASAAARLSVGAGALDGVVSPGIGGGKRGGTGGGSPGGANAALAAQLEAAHARIGELTSQAAEVRLSVESLEKERDFYFGKLRDVEILLQAYTGPDRATVDALFKILYATDDDFVAEGDDGGR